jgi:hypothetical protein
VSRHAQDGQTRLRALGRLQDADEILNVALKSEHTDVAVSALERIDDPGALSSIAQRARNRVAARRARTKLRRLEEDSQPAPSASMSADDRARAVDLLHRAEALVATTDPEEASASLGRVRLAWAELQADVEVDAALVQQFEAASDAAREGIEARRREALAERERERALAREQADRLAIVEEIERISGPGALDRIAELRVKWDQLPPMPPEFAASLTLRFQDASRAFEDRERRRLLSEAAAVRLDTLATELEQLSASDQAIDEVVARWRGLRRDADVLREHATANVNAAERLERAVAALEQKEVEHQLLRAKREQDNLRRLQQCCRQADALASSDQLTLKAGDRALREIRAALDERAPLPSKRDRQEIQARLEEVRTRLAPRVQELREADEWQRWANLQVQESICREMEALKAEEDVEIAARRMRELQARWKQVALAPRAQGEAMWRRFKAAQDEVFARTAAFFAAQHGEREANLLKKQALCERVESLAGSTDWVKTAAAIQSVQAEWKTVGPVARGHEKAVWERFRRACDEFFTRRQQDLKQRKEEWAANLARKEALCASAEELTESTDWESAAARIKRLQAEWKRVGPVRKSRSDAIWQRFRAACDGFFERYKHRDQVELREKAVVRETLIRELEALTSESSNGSDDNLYQTLLQARARWQQAPELPRTIQQDLAARYHQAVARIVSTWPAAFAGTDLDPEATQKRMERLLAKVEELISAQPGRPANLSPSELLAQQWRDRLAANTMAGGARIVETEESRWRAIEQEVRAVQAQWMRLGPVPPHVAGPLNERFQRACRRFFEERRRAS